MNGPDYDWKAYNALENSDTEFSRRNVNLQNAVVEAASELEERLQGRIHALEFGSGKGFTTDKFLERYNEMDIACVEKDEIAFKTSMNALGKYAPRVGFFKDDFLKRETRQQYDLVYGVFVVHNFDDDVKMKFFEKAYSLLSPGGLFIIGDVITESNPVVNSKIWEYEYSILNELPEADRIFWKKHYDETDSQKASSLDWHLKTLSNITGFKDVQCTYQDNFWKVIRAKK